MRKTPLLLIVALPLVAAACGGSGASNASASASAGTAPTSTVPSATSKRPPGTSGKIAAITAASSSMQVQSPTIGEVTVNWTTSTRFTQTRSLSAGAVAVGDCVAVTGTPGGSTSISARSVSITPAATGGTCKANPGGGGGLFAGRRPNRTSGSVPRGSIPSTHRSVPSGAVPAVAFGKVTATSSGGFTVSGTLRKSIFGAGRGSTSSTSTTAPATQTISVTASSSTTYMETGSATSSALAVGSCVTAVGPASDTGAVTASTIAIRPAVNGQCNAGFGGFARGGGAGTSTGA